MDVVDVGDGYILFQGISWAEKPITVNLSDVGSFQLYMGWLCMKRPGGAAFGVDGLV